MHNLVKKKKAPAGAVCPQPIPDGGLWKLDIDDDIWQDVGLDEGDSADHTPAPWLKDEDTRTGIRHMLKYDRAIEEESRVICERVALQEVAQEEWEVIQGAIAETGIVIYTFPCLSQLTDIPDDIDIIYQLDHRARDLCRLCYLWRESTTAIPAGDDH